VGDTIFCDWGRAGITTSSQTSECEFSKIKKETNGKKSTTTSTQEKPRQNKLFKLRTKVKTRRRNKNTMAVGLGMGMIGVAVEQCWKYL